MIFDYLTVTPFQYQIDSLKKYLESGSLNFGYFLELGLGKSLVTIMSAIERFKSNEIDSVVVCCPSSLIKNWECEVEKLCSPEYHGLFKGLKKADNLSKRTEWNFISHDQLSRGAILPFSEKTLLVVEESHNFKNPTSKRTKNLLKQIKNFAGVISLSGTPKLNSALDLYIQTVFLGLGYKKTDFIEKHCYEKLQSFGGRIQISYSNTIKNENDLMEKLKPVSIWIKKADVLDLPDQLFIKKYYELNKKQKVLIDKINGTLPKDLDDNDKDLATKIKAHMTALNMVHSGFFIDSVTGGVVDLEGDKIKLLETMIQEIPESEQFIIFCNYHGEIELISSLLNKLEIPHSLRYGKSTVKEKDEAILNFKSGKTRVLLGTTAANCEGLTLTNCNTIIYYSNDFSLKSREQSIGRIHRISQTKTCVYLDLISDGGFDDLILRVLSGKSFSLNNLYKSLKSI